MLKGGVSSRIVVATGPRNCSKVQKRRNKWFAATSGALSQSAACGTYNGPFQHECEFARHGPVLIQGTGVSPESLPVSGRARALRTFTGFLKRNRTARPVPLTRGEFIVSGRARALRSFTAFLNRNRTARAVPLTRGEFIVSGRARGLRSFNAFLKRNRTARAVPLTGWGAIARALPLKHGSQRCETRFFDKLARVTR